MEPEFRVRKSRLNGTWQHVSLHALLGTVGKDTLNYRTLENELTPANKLTTDKKARHAD